MQRRRAGPDDEDIRLVRVAGVANLARNHPQPGIAAQEPAPASPDDLAFVTSATGAVNAVIRSMRFEPGDELLTDDHEYNATINVLRHVAERDRARVVVARIPFPLQDEEDIVAPILGAVTSRT